jgi:hypothetical protein
MRADAIVKNFEMRLDAYYDENAATRERRSLLERVETLFLLQLRLNASLKKFLQCV